MEKLVQTPQQEDLAEYRERLESLKANPDICLDEYERNCLLQLEALDKIDGKKGFVREDAYRYLSLKDGEDFKYEPTDVLRIIETIEKEEA